MAAEKPTTNMAWRALRHARRLVILVGGGTVLAVGVAMIVLPGPAVVVIPIGLAILATEFVWAARLLRNLRERGSAFVNSRRGKPTDGSS